MTLLRVCRCGKLIPATRRRCLTCDRTDSARRNRKPTAKIYQSSRWRGPNGTRRTVLERDEHTCQLCRAPATHVDHQPPVTTLLARGLDPFDPDHCRALCASCAGRADAARAHTQGGGGRLEKRFQPETPSQLAAKKISPRLDRPDNQWVRPDGTKSCSKCERALPVDCFRTNPRLSSGLDSWCRECHVQANRAWRAHERAARADADTGPLVA